MRRSRSDGGHASTIIFFYLTLLNRSLGRSSKICNVRVIPSTAHGLLLTPNFVFPLMGACVTKVWNWSCDRLSNPGTYWEKSRVQVERHAMWTRLWSECR